MRRWPPPPPLPDQVQLPSSPLPPRAAEHVPRPHPAFARHLQASGSVEQVAARLGLTAAACPAPTPPRPRPRLCPRPRPRLRVHLDAGNVVGRGLVSGGRDVDVRPDWAGHLGLGLHAPNIDLDTAALLRRPPCRFCNRQNFTLVLCIFSDNRQPHHQNTEQSQMQGAKCH